MKYCKKLNTGIGYAAWFGDYAIAATTGVLIAGRRVREDMTSVENLTTWVPVFKTYKKHYVEHVKNHNNDRLSVRAFARYIKNAKKYDPITEINSKNLGLVVNKMKNAYDMHVIYFSETDHQRNMPQFCRFGDYTINFASDGTEWCGGIRGNGYINVTDARGKNVTMATISPMLSDYLANIVMQNER